MILTQIIMFFFGALPQRAILSISDAAIYTGAVGDSSIYAGTVSDAAIYSAQVSDV